MVPVAELEKIPGARIEPTALSELTTLHLGGTPACTVFCDTREAVVEVVSLLDAHQVPLLIVGGGSNLVVADGTLDLVAVVLRCEEVDVNVGSGVLRAEAGAVWDEVVELAVQLGLGGIECLSGIPGSAGATPVQNVGAYGVEVSDVLTCVELYDRTTGRREWVGAEDLELSYRYSNLKFTDRAVVLAIELQLLIDAHSAPLRFGELARALGVSAEEDHPRRDPKAVREEVLRLRRGKGMVYEEADHDTWSAGSFFTNPIVDVERAEAVRAIVEKQRGAEEAATMPCYPAGEQRKLSAAWLIERAGFSKGYGEGPARLSTKHTLALTNRGEANTKDLVALARTIRDGVRAAFGVELVPEPVWVGVSLDE